MKRNRWEKQEGRKAVPASKMPDLGWDIAETQLQKDWKSVETRPENNPIQTTPIFQALITVAIIITTILEFIAVYVQEIPRIAKKTAQAIKSTIMKANHNKLFQNIKDSYKTAALAITIVTSTMDRTDHRKQPQIINRNTQVHRGTQKLGDEYDRPYQSHTSRTYNNNGN